MQSPGDSGGSGGRKGGGGAGASPGGNGGSGGDESATTKVALPAEALVLRLKLWSVQSGADHSAPSHPSPYESYMLSVQVPGGTACVAEYGAPPVMGSARLSQASDHDTSVSQEPLLTVTSEVMNGWDGGGCGGWGGKGGEGGDDGPR